MAGVHLDAGQGGATPTRIRQAAVWVISDQPIRAKQLRDDVTGLVGISIHDPDVVFTDLGLAILGAYLGWRLWGCPAGPLARAGAVLMGGLASAAFWGAVFHAFFPADTATLSGFIAWIPVVLSIVVAARHHARAGSSLLDTSSPGYRFDVHRGRIRRRLCRRRAPGGRVVHQHRAFLRAGLLILFLVAAGYQAIRGRNPGWTLIGLGLIISVGAALLQQGKVSIHPLYFDHNAVYHVVQTVAIVFLYFGFRRAPETPTRGYATRKHPQPRPE